MKIGDYVRTKHGLISKYVGFEKDKKDKEFNKYKFDSEIYWYYEYYNEYVYEEDFKEWYEEEVVKSKSNIIDLIEVGDYVNGSKVIDIAQAPEKALYLNDISQKGALIPVCNYQIKSIVTKEMFANISYKVGE
jgi:hypothetical protein